LWNCAMKYLLLFVTLVFASEHNTESAEELFEQNVNAPILVKIEEDEYVKEQKKKIYNGCYKDKETAARASDTLARKLMANGGQKLKLNFPNDDTEVYAETVINTFSDYTGVSYDTKHLRWLAYRWSKSDKKVVNNGYYRDKETAAHASDTLARKLMTNGEQNHKLNFPDDDTEVYFEEKTTSSQYIGVSYIEKQSKWQVSRWSKNNKKVVNSGNYKDEKTAARASDVLARKLMTNGEQNHKLNFPDSEVHAAKVRQNKRKRLNHFGASEAYGNFEKIE